MVGLFSDSGPHLLRMPEQVVLQVVLRVLRLTVTQMSPHLLQRMASLMLPHRPQLPQQQSMG